MPLGRPSKAGSAILGPVKGGRRWARLTRRIAPQHELVDGRLKVVWRGVVAAMAVVNGGRGGVDIPDGDLRKVYDHLAAHYAQFEEEPPDFSG